MGWKKRLLTLMCAALLVIGPGLMSTARADNVAIYLLAENDVMVDLPVNAMPAWIGGVLYVPYTAFDWTVTGVNLGVSYGQIREGDDYRLTLYSLNGMLTFDINKGTCVDRDGQTLSMRAISRNGWIFVPVASVCAYFGLGYSYTPTSYGTLIRITNGQEWLDSTKFVQYAESSMKERYNRYYNQLNPENPQPSAQTTTRPNSTPEPTETAQTLYLSFLCGGGGDLNGILDQLEEAGVRALFLFRPEDLADSGETLRRMVGSGHLVGLSVTGATLSRVEEELETGSALLASLIRVQPHAVYLEAAGNDVAAALEGDGWACWTPQLRQLEDSRTAYNRSSALLSALDSRSGSVRLLLDDGAGTADLLDRLLPRLDQKNYQVRLPVETVF